VGEGDGVGADDGDRVGDGLGAGVGVGFATATTEGALDAGRRITTAPTRTAVRATAAIAIVRRDG
jgi:hypothetical protein